MSIVQNKKLSGYTLMSAGGIFLIAGFVGVVIAQESVFYGFFGIGAAFVAIGAAMLHKAKLE
ncbi:hypothetical protein [Alkalimonas amylolytica]|uniref:Uncharacterized protein n=1 Tax=Alkalimonas amylolytica TaxID=152573 RepID=A0A1H4FXS3_ALKAM|nr:hypothetical protein [Alkalimonas amylolytica]SEB01931.1 hypothetical protein SAMN04488051_11414 [Alkalimonas amylolytica]